MQIGDMKIDKGMKIDTDHLNKIFKEICKTRDRINQKDLIEFLGNLQSFFSYPKEGKRLKYANEEEAMRNWNAKSTEESFDIIKEICGRKEDEISFYSFQISFLQFLIFSEQIEGSLHRPSSFKPIQLFELDPLLQFTCLTLKEDSIFKKKQIKEKKMNDTKEETIIEKPKPEKSEKSQGSSSSNFFSKLFKRKKPNKTKTQESNKEEQQIESIQQVESIPFAIPLDPNFQLPDQKGLRITIFIIVFSYLPVKDILHAGLVSKEWLSISRYKFFFLLVKKNFNYN